MDNGYIAVDWGSTHLRAWRIEQGACTGKLNLACGITRLEGNTAEALFRQHLAPMRSERLLPVYMAGMVGSDRGWCQVDYLACPQPLSALSQQLYPVADGVWIVPGLTCSGPNGHDVMRGEETQLLGAAAAHGTECLILPGTHSKWALTDDGVVQRFSTAMTGELHHLLLTHSLLGQGLPPQQSSEAAFLAGAERGFRQPQLAASLFGVRANRLAGELAAEHVSEYLSGLLIASEISAMRTEYPLDSVTVVASDALAGRYRRLLENAGIRVRMVSGERAFLNGIEAIHYGR